MCRLTTTTSAPARTRRVDIVRQPAPADGCEVDTPRIGRQHRVRVAGVREMSQPYSVDGEQAASSPRRGCEQYRRARAQQHRAPRVLRRCRARRDRCCGSTRCCSDRSRRASSPRRSRTAPAEDCRRTVNCRRCRPVRQVAPIGISMWQIAMSADESIARDRREQRHEVVSTACARRVGRRPRS